VFTQNSTTTTTNYLYDGSNAVEDVDQSGSLIARYAQTQNIDEPLAEQRSGTTSYYEADGLGSVTSLTSSAGAIANTNTYDSFGKVTASTGSISNRFQYTAREFDSESGLYFYRARYYDPGLGRFSREDPLKGISGGMNFYSYVRNSPVGLIDPSGLAPDCPCATTSKLRLVPVSDCSRPGYRRIVYELQGPGAANWWVTEHQDPPNYAGSPSGQSTGDTGGSFDDGTFGWGTGNSLQRFTISPKDPTKSPNTPSCSVNVQLPSGPNGKLEDYGTLGIWHGGLRGYMFINGNSTGWVPCNPSYDEPGFH
jgi:RHS repeat-associated protein